MKKVIRAYNETGRKGNYYAVIEIRGQRPELEFWDEYNEKDVELVSLELEAVITVFDWRGTHIMTFGGRV